MQLIAFSPTDVARSHDELKKWVELRIKKAETTLREAEQCIDALAEAKMRLNPAQRMHRKAMNEVQYYKKIQAAIEAGYHIVPSFAMRVFAIRTSKRRPPKRESKSYWNDRVKPDKSPVGEGQYVSEKARREVTDVTIEDEKEREWYENIDFREVQFPVTMVRPEIVSVTDTAMRKRIFDRIGIVHTPADPFIVGEVLGPGTRVTTFFIAWWLDTDSL